MNESVWILVKLGHNVMSLWGDTLVGELWRSILTSLEHLHIANDKPVYPPSEWIVIWASLSGMFVWFSGSSNTSANAPSPDSNVTVVPLGESPRDNHSDHLATPNGSAQHDQHQTEQEHHPYVILFLMVSFATGVLVRGIIKKLTWFKLPYTVVLLMLGALFGLVSARIPMLQLYTALGRENPHVILHTFLPVLIFESAFAMETHTFLRSSVSVSCFLSSC